MWLLWFMNQSYLMWTATLSKLLLIRSSKLVVGYLICKWAIINLVQYSAPLLGTMCAHAEIDRSLNSMTTLEVQA